MAIAVTVNGKGPGDERLFAAVGVRRFPAPVRVTNTGSEAAEVELRWRLAGARVRLGADRWTLEPGAAVETSLVAETPSQTAGDTVLEVVVNGVVDAEFRLTTVSLARESVFHNLVPRAGPSPQS